MMIISFKKSRKIGRNSLSLTGQIFSVKNNDVVEFESQLERNLTYILERRQDIEMYCEQPITIEYFDGDQKKFYTPDFYVKYFNGLEQLIEVKYQKELIEKKQSLEGKFKAAKEFCNSNKIEFRVLTENEIETNELFNSKFLCNYKRPYFKPNLGDIEYILDVLSKFEIMTITNLLSECSKDDNRKAELLFHVWYLISNYLIKFNEEGRLSMDTQIWK